MENMFLILNKISFSLAYIGAFLWWQMAQSYRLGTYIRELDNCQVSLSFTKIFKQYKYIHPFTDLEHFGRTQHDK